MVSIYSPTMGRKSRQKRDSGRSKPASSRVNSVVNTGKQGKGPYQTLLDQAPTVTPKDLRNKRIETIGRIQNIRSRPLIAYVTNVEVRNPQVPALITREDIIPFYELISDISTDEIDVLIESPGGYAEVTIELVNLLRPKFKKVGFIIPHVAMSAATIMVMSGDEILMDYRSSLGPIDPQFPGPDGRPQPAQAILTGIDTIKKKADEEGRLHPVYAPILRNVDPGKYQSALNASQLSIDIVTDYLVQYKFGNWTTRETSGIPVTDEYRRNRAASISSELCSHQKWLSHGRPIKIGDLERMGLRITDYKNQPELQEAIWELWVNMHHQMASSNIYKMFESETKEFWKVFVAGPPANLRPPQAAPAKIDKIMVDVACNKCGRKHHIQCNLAPSLALENGAKPFPKNAQLECDCGAVLNLEGLKLKIESDTGRGVLL